MEDQFDRPMLFNPALIMDPAVAGQNVGAWGQGVAVYGGRQRLQASPYNANINVQYVWV